MTWTCLARIVRQLPRYPPGLAINSGRKTREMLEILLLGAELFATEAKHLANYSGRADGQRTESYEKIANNAVRGAQGPGLVPAKHPDCA
jgi:hypothetical protein